MRSKFPSSFRALSVLAIALAGVMLVSGISPGATKFLTKKKALKLFYTKAKADDRFLNVGEVEQLTSEGWHEVGTAGEPSFGPNDFVNFGSIHNTVAFFKDPLGLVHLKGIASCLDDCHPFPSNIIFTLPAGYHPAAQEAFPVLASVVSGLARVDVTSTGVVILPSATAS